MYIKSTRYICLTVILIVFASIGTAADRSPIVLGQSCALEGPTKNLGIEMRAGLVAAIDEQNSKNGIKGRKILLISKDDGYEPYRAVNNTLELINHDNVFLLIGEVGTPTSKAVVPIIDKAKVPFVAPLTGADFLRDSSQRYVVNIRGSYYEEVEKIISYLVDRKGKKKIACFYQNDSYGYAGLQGIVQSLDKRGLHLVATASYERNTVAVLGALKEINRVEHDAVVMIGAYAACGEYIKLHKLKYKSDPAFCNISFVGSKSLKRNLGSFSQGVVISQVVPFPWDTSKPIVKQYQEALKKYHTDFTPGFGSLEGYIAGRFFIQVAQNIEGELTREKFLQNIYKKRTFDLGGLVLEFGEGDNQGSSRTYLTEIQKDFIKLDFD